MLARTPCLCFDTFATSGHRSASRKANKPRRKVEMSPPIRPRMAKRRRRTRLQTLLTHETVIGLAQPPTQAVPVTDPATQMPKSSGLESRTQLRYTHTGRTTTTNSMSKCRCFLGTCARDALTHDCSRGAMFVVLRRSKGWWEVQRDPTGSGAVDDRARRCWVPAGCLLETSVPPATAISEALVVASAQPPSPSPQNLASPVGAKPMSDSPILPSSIVSTSYPGVALMDWQPQGDHELDLVKDDLLRVFKRYNHWSYVGGRSNFCDQPPDSLV